MPAPDLERDATVHDGFNTVGTLFFIIANECDFSLIFNKILFRQFFWIETILIISLICQMNRMCAMLLEVDPYPNLVNQGGKIRTFLIEN